MEEGWKSQAERILDNARQQIKEASSGDRDIQFKINRYVYARLQLDERKTKPKKTDLFDSQKGICWFCKKRIESVKDTDTHRLDEDIGYGDVDSVVLIHRSCHQQMQAKKSSR